MKKILIGPFKQLYPLSGLSTRGALNDNQLHSISIGGIVMESGKIVELGSYKKLKERHGGSSKLICINDDCICLPGFIDCHTHIAFAGERSEDFALRNAGASYLDIASAGGGIWSTVKQTREISFNQLVSRITKHAFMLIRQGITTIEVKSGYGLTIDQEVKILRAIKQANKELPIDLISTCLAAHIRPQDFNGTPEQYLTDLVSHLFPILKREGLTSRIDAFVEQSAFSVKEIQPYLQCAKEMGFTITLHADQFTTGGSQLACSLEAISADHLEASTEKEIQLLGTASTTAVALPGASLGLGMEFAPCRKLLDAGATLAIASDWNPGSAPMGQLMTQATILASAQKLTNTELFASLTFRSAKALDLTDRGTLIPGSRANFNVYKTDSIHAIPYFQGALLPKQVWANGQLIYDTENELSI